MHEKEFIHLLSNDVHTYPYVEIYGDLEPTIDWLRVSAKSEVAFFLGRWRLVSTHHGFSVFEMQYAGVKRRKPWSWRFADIDDEVLFRLKFA